MSIDTSKYTNHTKEEIEEYWLTKNKQKQMLIKLEANDFCYSADNYNDPQERLYFFCREYELDNWGTIENVEVYIKIARKQDDFIVVVSFHKPEKNIKKLFL